MQGDKVCRRAGGFIGPGTGRSWWWLRTARSVILWADVVMDDGLCHFSDVYDDEILVRPALWIDLTTDLF